MDDGGVFEDAAARASTKLAVLTSVGHSFKDAAYLAYGADKYALFDTGSLECSFNFTHSERGRSKPNESNDTNLGRVYPHYELMAQRFRRIAPQVKKVNVGLFLNLRKNVFASGDPTMVLPFDHVDMRWTSKEGRDFYVPENFSGYSDKGALQSGRHDYNPRSEALTVVVSPA